MNKMHIAAAVLVLLTASAMNADTPGVYRRITAREAKAMMDKGGVTIVDVRRPDEYSAGHIPGAVLVTLQTIETDAPAVLKDKKEVLLVYCRTGIRSERASRKLLEMGYENVYDIAGGITQWPYEVTKTVK